MAAFGQAAPPDWFDGSSVDEIAFSEYVLYKHPMRCIHDRLYDIDGLLSDAAVQSEILEYVRPYVKSNVAKNVEKYLNALKLAAYCPELPIQEDRIHFQNGTYFIEDRRFTPEKEFCLNRLPVRYDPEAPVPERWLKFLGELLYPEDIPTLQEFMGYTLLPSNKGQKMMIIIGNGGEGKSRIGRVLRAILGDNMNTTAIDKLSKDKFCRADQEGKLLMLDDDMKLQALDDTNILKAIITMEDKMDLERKNMQSYQGFLYVRLLGLGNGSLSALYDRPQARREAPGGGRGDPFVGAGRPAPPACKRLCIYDQRPRRRQYRGGEERGQQHPRFPGIGRLCTVRAEHPCHLPAALYGLPEMVR